ncbi:MAG: FHA domain-containing protein [Myxococcota bacterium]
MGTDPGQRRGARAAYVAVDGPGFRARAISLKEGITSIGRLPTNDIVLADTLVSRHHARISLFEERATLQDLGSHNGCFINERRVYTSSLKDQDVIRIGGFRLTFRVGEAPAHLAAEPVGPSGPIRRGRTASHGGTELAPLLLKLIDMVILGHADRPLDRACASLEHAFQTERCGVVRVKRNGRLAVAAGRSEGRSTDAPGLDPAVIEWVIRRRFPVAVSSPIDDPRFPGSETRNVVACVPIGAQSELLGALYLERPRPPVSLSDLDALQGVASLLGAWFVRHEAEQPPWNLPGASAVSTEPEAVRPGHQPAVALTLELRPSEGTAADAASEHDDGGSEWGEILRCVVDVAARKQGILAGLEEGRLSLVFFDDRRGGSVTALGAVAELGGLATVGRLRLGVARGSVHVEVWVHQGVRRLLARGTALLSSARLAQRAPWGGVRIGPGLDHHFVPDARTRTESGLTPETEGELELPWADVRGMIAPQP